MDIHKIREIKQLIENEITKDSKTFAIHFSDYFNIMLENNAKLVILNEEDLKKSYANEISALLLILSLLKKYAEDKSITINLSEIVKRFDKSKLFTWHKLSCENQIRIESFSNGFTGFQSIVSLYEQMQLKADKKLLGQYYTPGYIVDKMLDAIDINYEEIDNKSIIDPACGGGIFFIKIIEKLTKEKFTSSQICNLVNNAFYGYDINPFAVFLCKTSIALSIIDICSTTKEIEYVCAKIELPNIKNSNAITVKDELKHDIVIGNPPYFKIKNSEIQLPEIYSEILNGQGNIYALFIKWSIENIKDGGKICLIIPQSFRSGLYFKKLRNDISQWTIKDIISIDSKNRSLIFDEAEQAVLIINILKQQTNKNKIKITVSQDGKKVISSAKYDQKRIIDADSIIIPTSIKTYELVKKLKNDFNKFSDIERELTFGNGLFVWNQNKDYICREEQNAYPIIYANYIRSQELIFDVDKNNESKKGGRRPYCTYQDKLKSFLCKGKRLIIKRTSGMENFYRIKSCLLDDDFVVKYQSYYVENHVNMLYDRNNKNKEVLEEKILYIKAFLNSDIANFYFKFTNGNTQVSATELNALPYVIAYEFQIIELMKMKQINYDEVNKLLYLAYGLSEKEIEIIQDYKRGYKR